MLFFFNGCKSIVWSQFIALGIVLITISFFSLFHFRNVPLNYIISFQCIFIHQVYAFRYQKQDFLQKNTLKTFNLTIFFIYSIHQCIRQYIKLEAVTLAVVVTFARLITFAQLLFL